MLQQYFGMKARHPEAVLLSRVGDFYEAYGEDAETIARALSIALTSKEAGGGKRVAMAGVPHHALSQYLARLVQQRFIVALAEQLEVPQPNKLVRRDVVRLVTPGTLVEDQLLDGKQNNYLAAVTAVEETFALAYADVSTGLCAATALTGESAYDELLDRTGANRSGRSRRGRASRSARGALRDALENIGARVAVPSLSAVDGRARGPVEGFSLDESLAIHRAVDGLVGFVKRTGVAIRQGQDDGISECAAVLSAPQRFLRSIRIHARIWNSPKRSAQTAKATLLATLDKCATSMGSRMLARWILAPLVNRERVIERQRQRANADRRTRAARLDAGAASRLLRFGTYHAKSPLQARASARPCLAAPHARDRASPRAVAPKTLSAQVERIGEFEEMLADLQRTLVDEPPAAARRRRRHPAAEADAELAECVRCEPTRALNSPNLEERERERTGIKSLKIKYASAFGYAIEISKGYVAQVPSDYVRKQTLTSGERFITPELKELEIAISTAQSRQQRLEERLFGELLDRIAARVEDLLCAAEAIAEIDVLCAFAQCAAERGYVCPTFISRQPDRNRRRASSGHGDDSACELRPERLCICARASIASFCLPARIWAASPRICAKPRC